MFRHRKGGVDYIGKVIGPGIDHGAVGLDPDPFQPLPLLVAIMIIIHEHVLVLLPGTEEFPGILKIYLYVFLEKTAGQKTVSRSRRGHIDHAGIKGDD